MISKTGRVLTKFPYTKINVISYGIVLRAKDIDRYLILRRSHSFEYLTILSGNFNISSLVNLSKFLSDEEMLKLKSINRLSYSIECFNLEIDENSSFFNKLPYVITSLNGLSGNRLVWTWPKGGKYWTDKSNLDAAIRELKEETGISITSSNIYGCVYKDKVDSLIDRNITNVYYQAEIDKAIIPQLSEESSLWMWATIDDLYDTLPSYTHKPQR